MLESGKATSFVDIANKEGVDNSYVCRLVNLTTLSPEIIQAILNEELGDAVTLHQLAIGTPYLWSNQLATG